MEKRKMSITIGKLKWDAEKKRFSGFVNGDYVQMKEHNGDYFINALKDVTFFEAEPREQQYNPPNENVPF